MTGGADGAAETPQVATADAPYAMRMIVRRSVDPAKFSGSVQQKVMRDGDIWAPTAPRIGHGEDLL